MAKEEWLKKAKVGGKDLSGANLSGADLSGAVLPKVIKVENLFTKILKAINSGGELDMGDWHTCETTHCVAGWVIPMAGEFGQGAETFAGTSWAAALIINASCPYLEGKVPNFYDSNKDGMKFIEKCAAKEAELINRKI